MADLFSCDVFSTDDLFELRAKGESFKVPSKVLTRDSEYFETCLNGQFREAKDRVVDFGDEIDPRYLALYIGLAYSHSTIVPHAAPPPAESPEIQAGKTPLRDFVEVYKLCDRFLSPAMAKFVEQCIHMAIRDGHRALFRTESDDGIQQMLMRDFADAYEALSIDEGPQGKMAILMMEYFGEGVSYRAWSKGMETVTDRSRFVGAVSKQFASKLERLQGGKCKRKELKGPN